MSSGQRPRTPVHFPDMKYRAEKRHQRAVWRRFRRQQFVWGEPDLPTLNSRREAEVVAEIYDTARKMAEKTRVPKLWYYP